MAYCIVREAAASERQTLPPPPPFPPKLWGEGGETV